MRDEAFSAAAASQASQSKRTNLAKGNARQDPQTPTPKDKALTAKARVKEVPMSPDAVQPTPSKTSKMKTR